MSKTNPLKYAAVADLMEQHELMATAVEAHGVICGLVCGGVALDDKSWLPHFNDLVNDGFGLPAPVRGAVEVNGIVPALAPAEAAAAGRQEMPRCAPKAVSGLSSAQAQALEQAPVGDKYAQVSYETLVKMRRELKGIFGPCNERLMLKAMRLYGAFATLNVRFSNDKLLSMGMPKPPRFTDYIDRCVETTRGLSIPQQMAVDFK